MLPYDAYYTDQGHLAPDEREKLNYDHPDALDTSLLLAHLRELVSGRAVEMPTYDFATHRRRPCTRRAEPREVILIDGILCLADASLRQMMQLRLFVDAPDDVRFIRRLRRDLQERGRSLDSVLVQYLESVRPMYLQHVEPSRHFADLVVRGEADDRATLAQVVQRIRELRGGARARGREEAR